MEHESNLAAVAAAAANLSGPAPLPTTVVVNAPPAPTGAAPAASAPDAPTAQPAGQTPQQRIAAAQAELAAENANSGISAASALELVATAYPTMAGSLTPLAQLCQQGCDEKAFTKALVQGMQATPQEPINTTRSNTIQTPAGHGASPETKQVPSSEIYAERAKAMGQH